MSTYAHPRLLTSLVRLFGQSVDIQSDAGTQDTSGQVIPSWVDLAGHTDLPCRVAPAGGQEARERNQTYAVTTHTIIIAGYYPTITAKMRAVVGAVNYDIETVGCDSEHLTTRLSVRIVT
jgi:head-tail adaptor